MNDKVVKNKNLSVAQLRLHHSSSGYRGVYFNTSKNSFICQIGDRRRGPFRRKSGFKTAEEAALQYDEFAREIYGDHACLNFPAEGERATVHCEPIPGMCLHGHDLVHYGRTERDGQITCLVCNRGAVNRYKQRIRKISRGFLEEGS